MLRPKKKTLEEIVTEANERLLSAKTLQELDDDFQRLYRDMEPLVHAQQIKEEEKKKNRKLTTAEKKAIPVNIEAMFDEGNIPSFSNPLKTLSNDQLNKLLDRITIAASYYHGAISASPESRQNNEKSMTSIAHNNGFGMANFFKSLLIERILTNKGKNLDSKNQQKLITKFEKPYTSFEHSAKRAAENDDLDSFRTCNLSDIRENYYLDAKQVFTDDFLPKAKDSKLLHYLNGLASRIETIKGKTLTDQEKRIHTEKAFLDTYYEVRKHQGWFDDSLADALEEFLISPNGLNLRHKYGPKCLIPHHVNAEDNAPILEDIKNYQDDFAKNVLTYFDSLGLLTLADRGKGQDRFNAYLKKYHLGFTEGETIDLNNMDDKQRARVRYIIYDLALHLMNSSNKNEREQGKDLLGLLSKSIAEKDQEKYPFTIAYQKLKVAVSTLHLKTHREKAIEELMEKIETIREDYPNDEKKAYRAMQKVLEFTYSRLKDKVKKEQGIFSIFNGSNLANTLEKFLKKEFKLTKIKYYPKEMELSAVHHTNSKR